MVERTEDETPPGRGCPETHDIVTHRLNLQDAFLFETFANYKTFMVSNGSTWKCCEEKVDTSTWPLLDKLARWREQKEKEKIRSSQNPKAAPTPVICHTKTQIIARNSLGVVGEGAIAKKKVDDEVISLSDDDESMESVSQAPTNKVIHHSPSEISSPPCDNIEDDENSLNSHGSESGSEESAQPPVSTTKDAVVAPRIEPSNKATPLENNNQNLDKVTNPNTDATEHLQSLETGASDNMLQEEMNRQIGLPEQRTEVRVSDCAKRIISSTHDPQAMNSDNSKPQKVQNDCPDVIDLCSGSDQDDDVQDPIPSRSVPSSKDLSSARPMKVSVRHSITNKYLGIPCLSKPRQKKAALNQKRARASRKRLSSSVPKEVVVPVDNTHSEDADAEVRVKPFRIIKINDNQYSTSSSRPYNETKKPVELQKRPSEGETTSTSSLSETELTALEEYNNEEMETNYYMQCIPAVVYADGSQENQAIQSDEIMDLEIENPLERRDDSLTRASTSLEKPSGGHGPSIIIPIGHDPSTSSSEQVETTSDENCSFTSPNGSRSTATEYSPMSALCDGQESNDSIEILEVGKESMEMTRSPPPPLVLPTKASLKCMGTGAKVAVNSVVSSGSASIDHIQKANTIVGNYPKLGPSKKMDDSKRTDTNCFDSASNEVTQNEVSRVGTSAAATAVKLSPLIDNPEREGQPAQDHGITQRDNTTVNEESKAPGLAALLIPQRTCTKKIVYNETDGNSKSDRMRKSLRRRKRSTRMNGFVTKNLPINGSDCEESLPASKSSSLNAVPSSSNQEECSRVTGEQLENETSTPLEAINWRSVKSAEETVQVKRKRGRPPGSGKRKNRKRSRSVTSKRTKALTDVSDVEDSLPLGESRDGTKTDWNSSDEEPLLMKKRKSRQNVASEIPQSDDTRPRKVSLRNKNSKTIYTEVGSSEDEAFDRSPRRLTKRQKRSIPNPSSPVPGPSCYSTMPCVPPVEVILTSNREDLTTEEEADETVQTPSILKNVLSGQSNNGIANVSAAPTVVISISDDEVDPDATICIAEEAPSTPGSQMSTTTTVVCTPNNETTTVKNRPRIACERCGKVVAPCSLQRHYTSRVCKRRQENGGITGAEDSQTETEADECYTADENELTPTRRRKAYKIKPKVSCKFCRKELLPANIDSHIKNYCSKAKKCKLEDGGKRPASSMYQTDDESQAEEDDDTSRKDVVECEQCLKKLKRCSMYSHRKKCKGRKSDNSLIDNNSIDNSVNNDHTETELPQPNTSASIRFSSENLADELFIGTGGSSGGGGADHEMEVNVAASSEQVQEDASMNWGCEFEDCLFDPENQREYERHLVEHPPDERVICEYPNCSKVFFCELNMQDHKRGHVQRFRHDATFVSVIKNKFWQPVVKSERCDLKSSPNPAINSAVIDPALGVINLI